MLHKFQFDPRNVAPMSLWLDAQDYSTLTVAGGTVSAWRDKSGNGNHASQASPSIQPDYITSGTSGMPSIEFSGANDVLDIADSPSLNWSALTMFFVMQRTSDTGGVQGALAKWSATEALKEYQLYVENADRARVDLSDGTSATGGAITGVLTVGSPYIWSFRHSGTVGSLTRNGSGNVVSVTRNANNNTAGITVGKVAGATSLRGYLNEILIYPSYFSNNNMRRIEAYLSAKWRIPL